MAWPVQIGTHFLAGASPSLRSCALRVFGFGGFPLFPYIENDWRQSIVQVQ